MGLIAREVESRGIPTISMSSAYSITAAVNPPRAVYLDYPLGHTAGKPDDRANQIDIMRETLRALETIDTPGTIQVLPHEWSPDHSWKDSVMRPKKSTGEDKGEFDDNRIERFSTPQYQEAGDEQKLEDGCPTCVFLEDA